MPKAIKGARMTADECAKDIREWIAANRAAPRPWIDIAERLATSPDMKPAWRELTKRNLRGRHIMSMAIDSLDKTAREVRRTLPSAEETARLRAVESAARKLIAAIERAPLLDDAVLIDMNGRQVPFAWRPKGTKVAKRIFPMAAVELTDLLDFAVKRAAELRKRSAQNRTVKRQRRDPVAVAFIRHLATLLRQEIGETLMGSIARIATATLDRSDSITKEQVESILRNPSG